MVEGNAAQDMPTAAELREDLRNEIARLRYALRMCIARAGLPDAGDACRAVIKTAKEALNER